MMKAEELQALVRDRDHEMGFDSDGTMNYNRMKPVFDLVINDSNAVVRLFNGGTLSLEENLRSYKANYDGDDAGDGWDYSYAEGTEAIVKYTAPDGTESYFKINAWFDSWDNGNDDVWIVKEIEPVKAVVKKTWEEVK